VKRIEMIKSVYKKELEDFQRYPIFLYN